LWLFKTGPKRKNYVGQKFDRVKVISYSHQEDRTQIYNCLCECGTVFKVRIRNLKTGQTKSCGCWKWEYENLIRRGKKHPSYNHTKTKKEREIGRNIEGYSDWLFQVKKKANFICDCCGIKGNKLHSHHLNNYKDFPELRLCINNGVCLCENCHMEFHNKFSRFGNIKEQYYNFKGEKCQILKQKLYQLD
jgi:hypothetical protein